jgi:hypothetical protein
MLIIQADRIVAIHLQKLEFVGVQLQATSLPRSCYTLKKFFHVNRGPAQEEGIVGVCNISQLIFMICFLGPF